MNAIDRQKRLKQERDAIESAPVSATEKPYVEYAAALRALWAERQRDPRVCDMCSSTEHHGRLERRDPLLPPA